MQIQRQRHTKANPISSCFLSPSTQFQTPFMFPKYHVPVTVNEEDGNFVFDVVDNGAFNPFKTYDN